MFGEVVGNVSGVGEEGVGVIGAATESVVAAVCS